MHSFTRSLLDYRLQREAAILAALTPHSRTSRAITAELYADVDPRLLRAAERNVIAHLDKLRGEGRVQDALEGWTVAQRQPPSSQGDVSA